MKIRANIAPLSEFNMISLTDIVFLLLIFFLLSSTFVLQPGVKIKLPVATTSDVSSEKSIVISIAKDGAIYINDDLINRIELGARLRQRLMDIGNPIVVLRADRSVMVEKLVDVMDIAKTAGAEKFVIATAPKE